MAVVIDLDALRRGGQVEGLGQPLQQPQLGSAFRHAAGKAFAGVAQGVFHQLGFFAAPGDAQDNLAASLFRQRIGHQVRVFDPMRQQDQPWRHLAIIELRQERLHHLVGGFDAVEFRVEVPVPPTLVATDEKHLHAGLPGLHMQGDHIRLGHAARVDRLHRLHGGQRLDAVAQGGGAFVFHRFAGHGHFACQLRLNRGGLALQEQLGIGHQRVVVIKPDPADARRAAPLDLVQQAGPRPAAERRIGARAQQEHPLKLVQGPVHRPGTGKGAVIIALFRLGTTMLLDLGKRVRLGHQNVRERLVVAQKHIVARLELLDEVLFQQQRLGLGARGQEHHRAGFADHPCDPCRMSRAARIVRNPSPEVARLADVKHRPLRIQHPVDTRRTVERP